MAHGTVKWFNYKKRFGFIEPKDGGADIFVHITAIKEANINRLDEGQEVEFEMGQADNGKDVAINLKLVG